MNTLHHPLRGVRVLELAQVMAGPVCGLMLADLGAEVIKVEKFPGGDDARAYSSKGADDVSASFQILNRGKRSVALDLKSAGGRAALERLVASADVLTENFRPGVMERLGLGPADLHKINPKLIIASVTGYGRVGPLAGRGGFDLILQAFSGLVSVTGYADRPGVKPGVSVADVNAGILAAFGVVSAYIEVLRTGRGQRIDTSLLQASMQQLYWFAALHFSTGQAPERLGTAHPIIAPYQTYLCSDGELAIGGANESNWLRIAQVLGHPEWTRDERFSSGERRRANRAILEGLMNDVLQHDTRSTWEARLTEAGVPVGPVQTVGEALSHPQSKAVGMVIEAQATQGGTAPAIGLPVHFDGGNTPATGPAPRLGEHTVEVLRAAGLDAAMIDQWLGETAIFQSPDRQR